MASDGFDHVGGHKFLESGRLRGVAFGTTEFVSSLGVVGPSLG